MNNSTLKLWSVALLIASVGLFVLAKLTPGAMLAAAAMALYWIARYKDIAEDKEEAKAEAEWNRSAKHTFENYTVSGKYFYVDEYNRSHWIIEIDNGDIRKQKVAVSTELEFDRFSIGQKVIRVSLKNGKISRFSHLKPSEDC